MMDYLLVEHKDRCWDCDLMRIDEMHEIPFCGRTGGRVEMDSKPDWCPLRPIPEKRDTISLIKARHEAEENDVTIQHQTGFNLGWSACLDEITGGEN